MHCVNTVRCTNIFRILTWSIQRSSLDNLHIRLMYCGWQDRRWLRFDALDQVGNEFLLSLGWGSLDVSWVDFEYIVIHFSDHFSLIHACAHIVVVLFNRRQIR